MAEGVRAPGVDGLRDVVAGGADPAAWARSVTRPQKAGMPLKVAA